MGEQKPEKVKKHICTGLLAHVDAGKTTLSESILYKTGSIRNVGRVDHRDTFFDTDIQERERGITIFSKQAEIKLKDKNICLMDTPGHADFSAEMERTLSVLDYAILIISAADGIQGHVITLWKLLKRYNIPVFIFVNKMDQQGADGNRIMTLIREKLSDNAVDMRSLQDKLQGLDILSDDWSAYPDKFSKAQFSDEFLEQIAECDEETMESYFDTQEISLTQVSKLIRKRKLYPVCFGSALKQDGVDSFLSVMSLFIEAPVYKNEFGARIFKISRDSQGNRLTHMKITGGMLRAKASIELQKLEKEDEKVQKVDQIRIYQGAQFNTVKEACAGMVVAVTGLNSTRAGMSIGAEEKEELPLLIPLFTFSVILPFDEDKHRAYLKFKELEEEIPELSFLYNEQLKDIQVKLMGGVQTEVVKRLIKERFGMDVSFDEGHIVYKETIKRPVEGVGHYEPLRHYSEVHLALRPMERGSGLSFSSECSEDVLDKSFQNLILTHLEEKNHKGVLTGSDITDMNISILSGRAHIKNTEGGDFRQAVYRAVRNGLMRTESVLLEPYFEYRLQVPMDCAGRAISDLQQMNAEFNGPDIDGELAIFTGEAAVSKMQGYKDKLASYSRGFGELECTFSGYKECLEQDKVVEEINYDPEADLDNPAGSVFCSHGAGFYVEWDEVENYMHLPYTDFDKEESEKSKASEDEIEKQISRVSSNSSPKSASKASQLSGYEMDKELEAIFVRTFGNAGIDKKKPAGSFVRDNEAKRIKKASQDKPADIEIKPKKKSYLLVDGYNIIFAWDELRELSKINIDAARTKLMDILSNYQGFKGMELILVFDAYRVHGNKGEIFKYHNIHVVYTKEAETADQYIEKTVHDMDKQHNVTVATSDRLEQIIVFGNGAARMSARELYEDVCVVEKDIDEEIYRTRTKLKNTMKLPE
ncbi:MAG: TetM/TetW/TetO/TetS family tetracycline resistance ribosomal protection protein [Eubacteriales bacterium]|nr:TetM/TetW/TetO/TetS family tetracycline resistance ribosomal protection protein [Eubacteriales bacterium]